MARSNEKTTNQQYECMVSLMQAKPDIAQNYTKRPTEVVAAFWEDLASQLNQIGPRQRDVAGWKKVWSDFKSYIKKKLSANKKENTGTGGGPYRQKSFTPLEDAVIALVSINQSVDGIGAMPFGNEEEAETQPSTSTTSRTQSPNAADQNKENSEVLPKNSTKRSDQEALSSIQLLRKQVQSQITFFDEIKSSMEETTKVLQNTANILKDSSTNLKRVYRSVENVCEIEKKKI